MVKDTGQQPTNCLNEFDYFVGLPLKELIRLSDLPVTKLYLQVLLF